MLPYKNVRRLFFVSLNTVVIIRWSRSQLTLVLAHLSVLSHHPHLPPEMNCPPYFVLSLSRNRRLLYLLLHLDDWLDQVAHAELCLIVFYHLLAVFVCLPIPRPINLSPAWPQPVELGIDSAYFGAGQYMLFDRSRNLLSINVFFS